MITWFDAQEAAVPELASALPLESLAAGQFKIQRNVRPTRGKMRLRDGMVALTATAPASGTGAFRGGCVVAWGDDKVMAIAGVQISGEVRIYTNEITLSTLAETGWAEATASSGKFGDTRMDPPTKGWLQFQALPGRDGTEAVVVQNGIERPRMVDLEDRDARIIEPVQPADYAQAYSPIFTFRSTLPVASTAAAGITMTDSGASVTTSVVAAGTIRHWRAVFAAPVTGEWAQWYVTASSIDLRESFGSMLFIKATDDTWRGALKISLVVDDDAGGVKLLTVYDPSAQFVSMEEEATVDEGVLLVQFPVQEHPDVDIDEVKGIRIDVVRDGLAAGYTFDIRGVAATGNVPGGAQYGIALMNSNTRTESPGAPYRTHNPDLNVDEFRERNRIAEENRGRTPRGAAVGFEDVFTDGPYFFMPVTPAMYYKVELPIFAPIESEGAKGVDTAVVYRKDPNSRDFSFVEEVPICTYDTTDTNGATVAADRWETLVTRFASELSWKARATYDDNAKTAELDESRRLPDVRALPIPIGWAMGVHDKRFMVAVERGLGSPKKANAVMVSEEDRPTMFRPFPRFDGGVPDASSGYLLGFGDEQILKIKSGSASGLGSNTVNVLTDRRLAVVVGYKVFTVAETGAIGSDVVAEHNGTLMWVDQQLVARRMRSDPVDMSRERVQDLLDEIPAAMRKYCSAVVARDRLMVTKAGVGDTQNKYVLVYDEKYQKWVSEDYMDHAEAPQQILVWAFGGQYRIIAFDTLGKLHEYERPGQLTDNGRAIAFKWRTGAVPVEFGKSGVYGRTGVVAKTTSEDLDTLRIPVVKSSFVNGAGKIDLTTANPFQYAWDKEETTNNPPMGRDYGAAFELSGSLSQGLELSKWVSEAEMRVGDGPA